MMFGAPDVWDALMGKIAGISAAYLEVQVEAGASAVQLFDSWAGARRPADYRAHVHAVLRRRCSRAAGGLGVPRIHFGVGTGELLGLMGDAGADVVGVDWRVPLADGVRRVGGRAVQGNLDPSLVFAPTEVMLARATEIVEAGRAAPGHIFNLGHGVLPVDRPGPARPADRPRALPRTPTAPDAPRHGLSGGGGAGPAAEQRPEAEPGRQPDERRGDQERQHRAERRSAPPRRRRPARSSRPAARRGSRRPRSASGRRRRTCRAWTGRTVIVDIVVRSRR